METPDIPGMTGATQAAVDGRSGVTAQAPPRAG